MELKRAAIIAVLTLSLQLTACGPSRRSEYQEAAELTGGNPLAGARTFGIKDAYRATP